MRLLSILPLACLPCVLSAQLTDADLARLLPAIEQVESSGRWDAVGDNGRSLGGLQIQAVMVADVNRILGREAYQHADAFDRTKAQEIFRVYVQHYTRPSRLGRQPTLEDAARMWNGGPSGHRKDATRIYWKKVHAAISDR